MAIRARPSASPAWTRKHLNAKRSGCGIARVRFVIQLCALLLVACLVLGGSTYAGFLSDAVLQLLSIPLLMYALWRLPASLSSGSQPSRGIWTVLALCLAAVLLPVLQLLPLPPSIWTHLPGREPVITAFGLIGQDLPWMPLSLTPRATWLSALALLPPVAILLGTLHLGYAQRRTLTLLLLAVGVIGAFLGLAQVAGGPSSPLRFFPITNTTEAVGFFANRNHFSALLYCLMLLIAAWAVEVTAPAYDKSKPQVLPIMLCFAALVVLVAAQAMARSRAGLGLTIVALFGALALAASDRRNVTGVSAVKLIGGAVVLALTFTLQMTLYRVLDRFGDDPLDDARVRFAQRTIEAAKAYMPFGSGMGSFVQVYPMFEQPQDTMRDTFANRAHNDIIEFWLEAGAGAILLLALFLAWLAFRSVSIWRNAPPGARQLDHALARAATLIVALLLVHSFIDYPLRTEAMLAVMAFACGLLVTPPDAVAEAARHATVAMEQKPASRRAKSPKPAPPQEREPAMFPGFPAVQPAPPPQPATPAEWPSHAAAAPAPSPQPAPVAGAAGDGPAEWRNAATGQGKAGAPATQPAETAAWAKPRDPV